MSVSHEQERFEDVNPKLTFILHKFRKVARPYKLIHFLLDDEVLDILLSAVDNSITIDERYIYNLAKSITERRCLEKLNGERQELHGFSYVVNLFSKPLGLYDPGWLKKFKEGVRENSSSE